jgi:hypothetical protein
VKKRLYKVLFFFKGSVQIQRDGEGDGGASTSQQQQQDPLDDTHQVDVNISYVALDEQVSKSSDYNTEHVCKQDFLLS